MQNYLKLEKKGKRISVFDYYLKSHGGKVAFRDNLKQQDVSQLGTGKPFFNGRKLQGAKLK